MNFPPHIQKPKLCSLRKWETFTGYGFNLHSDKGKQGQFIGKVDPNSPAFHGGISAKDVLIEVNGVNVEDASHNITVGRVKSIPDRVDLFVCSQETYQYCLDNGIALSSAMHNIDEFSTPLRQPAPDEQPPQAKKGNETSAPPYEIEEVRQENLPERFQGSSQQQQPQPQQQTVMADATVPVVVISAPAVAPAAAAAEKPAARPAVTPAVTPAAAPAAAPAAKPGPGKSAASGGSQRDPVGDLSLDEMRSRIGQNRRNQVKMSGSSFSEKYSVFESL